MVSDRYSCVVISIDGMEKYSIEDTGMTDPELMEECIERWGEFKRPIQFQFWWRFVELAKRSFQWCQRLWT